MGMSWDVWRIMEVDIFDGDARSPNEFASGLAL
jgi:hypothetical protein